MGEQQLLLIILGVIVIAIAIAVGITLFTDNALHANRGAVTNDLVNLAARAQQFYRRPTVLDGGGNSFVGLTADAEGLGKLTNKPHNDNGVYTIQSAGTATGVVIRGVGTEHVDETNLVTMDIYVFSGKADSAVIVY